MRVTRWPRRARESARLAAIVLLPTPPLPPPMAIVRVAARLGCSTMGPPGAEPFERGLERGLDLLDRAEQRVEQRGRGGKVVGGVAGPARDVVGAVDLALCEQRDEGQPLERGGETDLEPGQPIAGV